MTESLRVSILRDSQLHLFKVWLVLLFIKGIKFMLFDNKMNKKGFEQTNQKRNRSLRLLGAVSFLIFIYFTTYFIHSNSAVARDFSRSYLSGAPQSQRFITVENLNDFDQGRLVPESSIFASLNMENYTTQFNYDFSVKLNRFWNNKGDDLQINVLPTNLSSDIEIFNKVFDISFYYNGEKYNSNNLTIKNEMLEKNSSIDISAIISFNENVSLSRIELLSIRNQNFDFKFDFNLI